MYGAQGPIIRREQAHFVWYNREGASAMRNTCAYIKHRNPPPLYVLIRNTGNTPREDTLDMHQVTCMHEKVIKCWI